MVPGGGFQPRDSFLDKLTAKQIDKVLDQAADEAKGEREFQREGIRLAFGMLLGFLLLVGFIIHQFLLFEKGELLREIIALVLGLAGGGTIGFGAGRATAKKPKG